MASTRGSEYAPAAIGDLVSTRPLGEGERTNERIEPGRPPAIALVAARHHPRDDRGFSVLTLVTVLTYTNAPPIPARVTDAAGATLFDKAAILHGQEVFLKYGLMEHGSLWGHGAYLGPDYSAEYLHRLAEICNDQTRATPRRRRELPPTRSRWPPVGPVDAEAEPIRRRDRHAGLELLRGASLEIQEREWGSYFHGATPAPGLPAPSSRIRARSRT